MTTGRQPNVLFIITDQQRRDHVGFMGNDVVNTPNLDRLAARGMVFDNAWVANPICMPNRSTLMTGRLPSAHGVIFNDRSLEPGTNTWVRTMRRAGWATGLFGKSHLQHGMSRNSVTALELEPTIDLPYPPDWDRLEDFELYTDGTPDWPDDFYGFAEAELAIDHGARVTGHHLRWALERGGRFEDLVSPYSPERPANAQSDRWWQIFQPIYGPEFHSTTFVAETTKAFIERNASPDQPWVAWASFPDPHHPFTPPGEWWGRHDPADMMLPSTIDDPLDTAPEYLRRCQQVSPTDQRYWVQPCGAVDHDIVREALAANYATIEMIDHAVGSIIDTIERSDQLDDTIVVFTSDHGDMMGDHGLMLKGYMPYRGTYQVPLVIADPRRSPGRTDSLVGSIDVASTVLELADVPAYYGMQGSSLVPVLDDPAVSVNDYILIEDDTPDHRPLRIPTKRRTVIEPGGLKYTRFNDRSELLFDLVADPDEIEDLAPHDRSRRTAAVELLGDALIDADDLARLAPLR